MARTPENRLPGVTREAHATHLRDVIMASFGLLHTTNTIVGDDYTRGVSGGERKRVSIAEVLLAGATLQCWDNSTRGLDSATALEFIRNLKISSDLNGASMFVSLYQASQEMYDQFDKVTVLYLGRQIYFGPASKAKEYFERMGYICADRQTTGDFLTSLTSPSERIIKPGYEDKVPRTPDQFREYWENSPEFKELIQEIDEWNQQHAPGGASYEQFVRSRQANKAKGVREKSSFTISFGMQVKLCMWRGFLRIKGDPAVTISSILGNTFIGLVVSSIFYNLPQTTGSYYYRCAALFFSILSNAMASGLEILTLYAQRPIIEKHARYAFYHPSAEAVSSIICDLPAKILTSIAFNLVLYFMVNLRRTPAAFFTFYLFSFICTLVMSAIFRTIASVSRSISEALTPASLMILMLVTTTGFVIPVVDMHPWFRWINYINPIAYSFESLMINEFRNRIFLCSDIIPSGSYYDNVSLADKACNIVGGLPWDGVSDVLYGSGTEYIELSFKYYINHIWRNLGIIIAFGVFFYSTYFFFAEIVSAQRSKGEILLFQRGFVPPKHKDEEAMAEAHQSAIAPQPTQEEVNLLKQEGIFAWKDVCYDIKIKGEPRRLLDHVDGWVQPGTLTALMGASGAGKTTLLDTLADRVTMGVVTGEMLVNGRRRDQSFQRKTGYVQQQDVHLATSTVREALEFSALLRQPAKYTKEEKLAYVDEVIRILEMEEYSDAIVGVPGEGLNVEQRKRLTIGVELAARPELLLFLDEPTSGLDSQTAWSIMMLMKKLTNSGQAILCTIHQPSAILFQQFDRLLLLKRGGQTVFYGDLGENASRMISYFERNGAPPCPPDANPAEWMLHAIGAAPGSHTDQDWHEVWKNSPEYREMREEMDEIISGFGPIQTLDSQAKQENVLQFATPLWKQTLIVTKRVFQQYWRTPSYIYAKAAMCIVSPLFIGFTFYKAKNNIQGMQNQMYAIFMFLVIFGTLAQQIMPHFVTQRTLYETRERPSKTYSWVAFIISNLVVEIPWQILMAVFSFFCIYYPIGFYNNASAADATAERGAAFFMMVVVFYVFTSTFAHMVVAGVDDADTAANFSNLLFMMCLFFCGVLAGPDALPGFWIFMYRVSPMTYIVGTFMSTGLAGNVIKCSEKELTSIVIPDNMNVTCAEYMAQTLELRGGSITDPTATDVCKYCSIATTDDYLATISAPVSEAWRNFGLIFVYIAFNCVACCFLYWLIRVPKKSKKKED